MKKILIVDDSKEIRQLVRTTLNLNDFTVVEASDGKNAIETSRKFCPDLIIMDINMPGEVDGIQATRHIKQFPETSEIPIIILSGSRSDRSEECFDAGAHDIMSKPFSPLDLITKIERLLELTT